MEATTSTPPLEEEKEPSKVKIWLPRLTRYERARIIGARALQIAMGAPILIEVPKGEVDPIKIATLELEKGVLPLTIRRKLPSGEYQDIPLSLLIGRSPQRKNSALVNA